METEHERKAPLTYIIVWIVSVALTLLDMALVRAAGLEVAAWYARRAVDTTAERLNFDFLINFVDRASLFVMVIAALGLAVALEHYFRSAGKEGKLLRKGWKPLAILLGVGLLSQLVRFLL